MEKGMRGCESSVTAQIHFANRSEPAKLEISTIADEKCRFGKIVLRGDSLELGIRQPVWERADSRGIAFENRGTKGVDLIDGNFHTGPENGNESVDACPVLLFQHKFVEDS